jgi:hypothetical protein
LTSIAPFDAFHHNYHTANGFYAPLAALLRSNGYSVPREVTFSAAALSGIAVLIVANALPTPAVK